ncbi:MAG: FecR domain-containing protein [Pseudomonadota bacterium]
MSDLENIRRQAHEWRARLDDDAVSISERASFHRWVTQDPAHRDAFDQAETRWQSLGYIDSDQFQALNPYLFKTSSREHWNRLTGGHGTGAGVALSLMLLLGLAFGAGKLSLVSTPDSVIYRTNKGQIDTVTLADGSSLSLGAASEVQAEMTSTERRLYLLRGELFVDVAHEPDRPLLVFVDGLAFKAVGTAFEVRRRRQGVRLAVSDGQVQVLRSESAAPDVTLTPGQGISSWQGSLGNIEALPLDQIGAWRDERLVYRGATLREVIDDANRYSATTIALASPSLETLRITATFRGDDIETMLATLEDAFPLRIDRSSTSEILLFAE